MSHEDFDSVEHSGALGENYAQALYELASEGNVLDDVADELDQIVDLTQKDHRPLGGILENRTIAVARRAQVIDNVLGGQVHDLLLKFLHVLNQRGRLDQLAAIRANLRQIIRRANGEVVVGVTTAHPLSDEQADGVRDRISAAIGKKAVLNVTVDDTLIGGMQLRIGDRLIDGSVAAQLRRFARGLRQEGLQRLRGAAATAIEGTD